MAGREADNLSNSQRYTLMAEDAVESGNRKGPQLSKSRPE
jgi:hypothetical protein